eukprot:jgi/Botrbrau1/11778/Bobra.0195s0102.1
MCGCLSQGYGDKHPRDVEETSSFGVRIIKTASPCMTVNMCVTGLRARDPADFQGKAGCDGAEASCMQAAMDKLWLPVHIPGRCACLCCDIDGGIYRVHFVTGGRKFGWPYMHRQGQTVLGNAFVKCLNCFNCSSHHDLYQAPAAACASLLDVPCGSLQSQAVHVTTHQLS